MDIETFQTPGDLLLELLKTRGWSQRTLAVILQISEATITRLMRGQQALSGELAIVLEELFGVPAAAFLALQSKLELADARRRMRPDPDRARRVRLHGDLPIAEMIKRGWLGARDVRDTQEVEAALLRFFGVKRIDEIAFAGAAPAHLAWARRARQIAAGAPVAPYSPQAARAAIPQLRALLEQREAAGQVPGLLAGLGIRLVIVEPLAGARIDGACLWLNERAPVIALSLRVDRLDNFWFVLRHELEHVLCRHGQGADRLDVELDGHGETDEERAANEAAREFGVPPALLDAFIAANAPFIAESALVAFAAAHRVHPGILAGQIQDRTSMYTGRYNRFRTHLAGVRAVVCAEAITDGWGKMAAIQSHPRSPRAPVPNQETVLSH